MLPELDHPTAEGFVLGMFAPADPHVLKGLWRSPEHEARDERVQKILLERRNIRGVMSRDIVLEEQDDVSYDVDEPNNAKEDVSYHHKLWSSGIGSQMSGQQDLGGNHARVVLLLDGLDNDDKWRDTEGQNAELQASHNVVGPHFAASHVSDDQDGTHEQESHLERC